MQFLVVAYDCQDEGAPARRMAAREAHLATIARYKASGNMRIGAAITDEDGKMIGSCIIAEFDTHEAFSEWLDNDPYVTENVWGEVQVEYCKVAPSFVNG